MESNLERVHEWCQRNMMDLNIAKCEVITFSRRTESNRHIHNYNINHQPLRRVTFVKDLGVLLDEKMTFEVLYNQIVSRGHSMLGFVKRQAKEYECPYVTKSLYCALVRPLLEYNSVVWDPVFKGDRNRIESIQRRRIEWSDRFVLPAYEARLSLPGLETLAERRHLAACMLVASCLNGGINSSKLADGFQFKYTDTICIFNFPSA